MLNEQGVKVDQGRRQRGVCLGDEGAGKEPEPGSECLCLMPLSWHPGKLPAIRGKPFGAVSPRRRRLRSTRPAAPPGAPRGPGQSPRRSSRLLQELNLRGREEYEVLDKRRGLDPEMGGKQRKRNPQEVVYNALQKDKMAEAYSEIGIKSENQRRRGKGHDGLYQGLSTATKDTYDALHMQALPPR
eukprot:XP_005623027.1 T-cell surface glycoprotein CD3 zeta chain [Canis lupus familiaris]